MISTFPSADIRPRYTQPLDTQPLYMQSLYNPGGAACVRRRGVKRRSVKRLSVKRLNVNLLRRWIWRRPASGCGKWRARTVAPHPKPETLNPKPITPKP